MARRAGLRLRFLAAFGAISGFSVIAAISGLSSISSIGDALEQVTEERTPVAVESLLLSRHVERVVTAAPSLLGARDSSSAKRLSDEIDAELTTARSLLTALTARDVTGEDVAKMTTLIDGLQANLITLADTLDRRRQTAERKFQRLQDLEATSLAIRRFLTPGLTILEARITQHRGGADDARLTAEIADLTAVQEAEFARAAVKDAVVLSVGAESAADLDLLAFPLVRALNRLEEVVPQFDDVLRTRLRRAVADMRALAEDADGVPALRRKELALTGEAEGQLAENTRLSGELRIVVDRLIARVNADIERARTEVRGIRSNTTNEMIGLVVISLVASVLIVWLYVDGNLLARLRSLSQSMLAVADGNLRIKIASPSGNDEITDMAKALRLFRDTAVEVEEKNLRRADEFLNVILPPSIAEELKSTGIVKPREYPGVAIIFTDIVGFTQYCETRDAQEIVSALDLFARRSEDIIREEGLEKIKTLGDGIMMTCNLELPHDDPVMASVRCVRRLAEAAAETPLDWKLTSGVHFGSVVGGMIGRDKFTFDIWAAAVNLASRLSDLPEAEIFLSPAAWDQVAGRFPAQRREGVEIKGLGQTEVYLLERASDPS